MFKTIITSLLVGFAIATQACDICGCAAGGNYFGILPRFQKNFVGIRYQYKSFTSKPHEVAESMGHDYFQTTELWGKYVPHHRVQLFAFIPYHNFKRLEAGKETFVQGLGDISILSNFLIFNTGDSIRKIWKQALQIGGGIKVPTGKHEIVQENRMVNQNLQPGSGTFDFPLNLIYTLRHKQIGLNSELNYSINTVNNQHYQFGNRLNSSMRIFYWKRYKSLSLIPQLGASYEKAESNKSFNKEVEFSGGHGSYALVGLDVYFKNLALGASFKQAIAENISGGLVNSKKRISANIIYLF
jgi:hypothetical protein